MKNIKKKEEKRNKNKSDYGENFIAPDGGYGWLICLTSGLLNLTTFLVFDQFGLLYREKLLGIGLTHSQITTIISLNTSITAFSGFLNGAIFRRFSYRQVAITSAVLTTIAILLTGISNSFETFLLSYGILLGFGGGVSYSATIVVLNVYFKERRSQASSLAWTVTGIGSIVFPYVITYLLQTYDIQSTILIIGAIAANSIPCSMTFQPVKWHSKRHKVVEQELMFLKRSETNAKTNEDEVCRVCYCRIENFKNKKNILVSESYPEKAEERSDNTKLIVKDQQSTVINKNQNVLKGTGEISTPKYKKSTSKCVEPINESLILQSNLLPLNSEGKNFDICKCSASKNKNANKDSLIKSRSQLSSYRKFLHNFELYLLKDLRFVNIITGLTIAYIADMNFIALRPFILAEYKLESNQIAFLMSMPGIPDLICRFLLQFVRKISKWENRTFFLLGIYGMIISRTIIALNPPYYILCIAFFCTGINRAVLVVFYGIIVADYVPLQSLPAALGLNRLFEGVCPFFFGTGIGIIRDLSNYQVTVHYLNILTMIPMISWTIEMIFIKKEKDVKQIVEKF